MTSHSHREAFVPNHVVTLDTLYARYDGLASGRVKGGDSSRAHAAVLDRLRENGRIAGRDGWTACVLERDGGMGRLRLVGTPPNGGARGVVPDFRYAAYEP
jgi:hypothetical protein